MATPILKDRKGMPIAKEAIEEFSAQIAGKTIRPGEPDYEGARRIWNAHVRRHPGLIVQCAGTADVVQAVKFARANNLLVAIRGGGHNVAGRALCDDGIVIDLSRMKAVFVDPAKRTARVQGGAKATGSQSPRTRSASTRHAWIRCSICRARSRSPRTG